MRGKSLHEIERIADELRVVHLKLEALADEAAGMRSRLEAVAGEGAGTSPDDPRTRQPA